jgi:hypothetical protein
MKSSRSGAILRPITSPTRPSQTSPPSTKPSMTPSSISTASASPIRWPCQESLLRALRRGRARPTRGRFRSNAGACSSTRCVRPVPYWESEPFFNAPWVVVGTSGQLPALGCSMNDRGAQPCGEGFPRYQSIARSSPPLGGRRLSGSSANTAESWLTCSEVRFGSGLPTP